MAYTETEENLREADHRMALEVLIDSKRECCPQWGNADYYDDCELCPAYNACMEETIKSKGERM